MSIPPDQEKRVSEVAKKVSDIFAGELKNRKEAINMLVIMAMVGAPDTSDTEIKLDA